MTVPSLNISQPPRDGTDWRPCSTGIPACIGFSAVLVRHLAEAFGANSGFGIRNSGFLPVRKGAH